VEGGSKYEMLIIIITVIAAIIAIGILAIVICIIYQMIWNHRIYSISDPDERIKTLEKAFAKGRYRGTHSAYYHDLSICYGEKKDYVQALEMLAQAESCEADETPSILIGASLSREQFNMFNRASLLSGSGQLQEAALLLDALEQEDIKDKPFLASIKINRAKIAVREQNPASLRQYLDELDQLLRHTKLKNKKFIRMMMLLLQAQLARMEGDESVVIARLDTIFSKCTHPAILRQARELQNQSDGGTK